MHRFDEITSEAKIPPYIDVAEMKLTVVQNRFTAFIEFAGFVEAEYRCRRGMRDFLRHKTERPSGTFVVKQDTAGQMQSVLLAVCANCLMSIGLRDSVGRLRIRLCLLVLVLSGTVTINF